MKFLAQVSAPKLTLTRTKRKCVINEISELITLYETTTRIELTLPSIFQGLKDRFYIFFGGLLLPRMYAV